MDFNKKYDKGNPVLSERLKTLRIERKLSQSQLASLIQDNGGKCKNENYISMLETAKRAISKPMAYCLARIFDIDPAYLLDEATEYRTVIEKNRKELQSTLDEASQESYLMFNAICSLAALNGYTIEMQDIHGGGQIEDVISKIQEYISFYRDGKKEFSLSLDDANRFGNMLSDIFMSHIKWNIQK